MVTRPGKRDAEGGVPYGNNVRWYTSEPTGDRKGRPYGNIRDFRIVGTGALDGPFSASLAGAAISRPWTRQHPGSCHCEERSDVAIRFLFYVAAGSTDCHSQCAHWLRNDTGRGSIAGFHPYAQKRKAELTFLFCS